MQSRYAESLLKPWRGAALPAALCLLACLVAACLSGDAVQVSGAGITPERYVPPRGVDDSRTPVRRPPINTRSALLVHVPAGPAWQDMAYLAATAAATAANQGRPSAIALPEGDAIGREVRQYLRRYKPTRVYLLGRAVKTPPQSPYTWRVLSADSADAAGRVLARTFWKSCGTAVMCPGDDYTAALTAAPLAARLRAPLLFSSNKGVSAETLALIKRLGVRKAVLIGRTAEAAVALKSRGIAVTQLADAKAVLVWMRKSGLAVTYLAAVNPTDRSRTVIKKLSLAGALLAAGREGMVVPLAYQTKWKVGFTGEPFGADVPKGRKKPKARTSPRKGSIVLGGRKYAFIATGGAKAGPCRLKVDLNGNGSFDDAGEGPLATADTLTLGGKSYAVTLGERSGVGKADVRLTWPRAEKVCRDLKAYYAAAGRVPEHLCIVGFPDAFPQAVIPREPGRHGDLLSDLPYANADDDRFAEIGVARLIGESASLATLYASRVLTYPHLLDPAWQDDIGQARWENTYWPLFANVGFKRQFRHDRDDLKWLVKPGPGTKGKRARYFDDDSALTHVACMVHMAHSWWKDLGQTYGWDSAVLLAPTLVESGGCLTATLDREADFRSIVARLLRNGAVGFAGNIRPGIACQEQLRLEFWNGVLAGRTIGQAHRRAQNSMFLTVLDTNQLTRGSHHYSLHIRALFGDPAFAMRVPSKPRSAPAHVTSKNNIVSVHAPAKWWPVKIRVPEDWKRWNDKDLYVCRGAGTYAVRYWCGEQYDIEETYFNAEIRTARRIKSITQVQSPVRPLGWGGKYWTDEHADGTRSYRWRVRMIDFDQKTGKIISKIDRADYRIEWR